jgi:hypothetical protein
MVSADASSYGLGAVLLQEKGEMWKLVAYASHFLSETERRPDRKSSVSYNMFKGFLHISFTKTSL